MCSSFAQQHGYLTLSAGPGFPVGEFANMDGNDPKSGIARPGGLVDLSYLHEIGNSHFGFTGTLRGRMNGISTSAAVAPFVAEYPNYSWSATKKTWKAATAMIGAYHHFSVTKNIYFEEALLLGVAVTALPDYSVTGLHDSGVNQSLSSYIQASLQKKNTATFSGLVKVGGGYVLTNKLTLIANLGFWYLNPTFKNTTQKIVTLTQFGIPGNLSTVSANSVTYSEFTRNYTQNMSSIDLTVGLSLRLP